MTLTHSYLFCFTGYVLNCRLAYSLFPPILDEQERLAYKQEFDRDHQEYKNLQAELDSINQDLADLDRELDRHSDGSPEFMVRAAASVWFFEVKVAGPPLLDS